MRGSNVWGGCEAKSSGEPVWSSRIWIKTMAYSSCWYAPGGGAADESTGGCCFDCRRRDRREGSLPRPRRSAGDAAGSSSRRRPLTGGLLPGQPLLQSSEQVDLPGCLPPSSSPTMTGQLIGGGGEAMPTKGPLRAPREVPVVSSLEIERLAWPRSRSFIILGKCLCLKLIH